MKKLYSRTGIVTTAFVSLFFVFFIGNSPTLAATTWFVDPLGLDTNTCTSAGVGNACLTIQAAVNKAAAGDTIVVAAGTYAEHVAVNKSLTINGANVGIPHDGVRGAESVVDGTDTDAAFAITANDVTIDGFTVENGSGGSFFSGIWSQTGTLNSKILNNIITQNGIGVWAQCGGNCLIEDNLFDSNNKPGPSGGAGISADNTTGLTINRNEFTGHTTNNPILFQAAAPDIHQNDVISNNFIHDNANGGSAIYALALKNASFTGNDIEADTSDIRLAGGNHTVSITNNDLHSTVGVNVVDDGFTFPPVPTPFGLNTDVKVNRNSLTGHTTAGVDNSQPGQTASVDATCNWWGAANGPGPVGPGTGDPVTANVTFTPWLTTNNLANDPCTGGLQTFKVHILKYLDGAIATAVSANNYLFPMTATWNAPNIGAGSGSFVLGNFHGGATDQYGADTAGMTAPYDYTTSEVVDNVNSQVVSAPDLCAPGKFLLNGYRTSTVSLADAATQPLTLAAPAFTGQASDQFIIVDNSKCPGNGSLIVQKDAVGGNGTFQFTGDLGNFQITTVGGTGSSPTFNNLAPGTYHINETSQSGWTLSDNECANVVVTAGQTTTCTVTNTKTPKLGVIRGVKYEDWDGDGSPFESKWEIKLSGWTIYIDTNNNGVLDGGEPSTVTNNKGAYKFTGLAAGTYVVREVQKPGWVSTYPSTIALNDKYVITLAAGQIAKKKDFGNFKLGSISGFKFNDANGNGKKDNNEVGLPGWTIKLKGPGANGPTIQVVTGANGAYSFGNLLAGTYTLSEVQQAGWKQTTYPGSVKIRSASNVTKQNFGNKQGGNNNGNGHGNGHGNNNNGHGNDHGHDYNHGKGYDNNHGKNDHGHH